MLRICAIAFAAMFSTASFAADLTVEQVVVVANGLAQLDGYEKVVKDGAQEKVVKVPYNFGGGLRWSIAGNLEKGRAVAKRYEDSRKAVFDQMAKDGKIPAEKEQVFTDELRKILDKPADIQLDHFKRDELKTQENPIPGSVLSLLLPIVDQ
jgi:hypothetical protein